MAITYTDNGGGAPNGSDLEFTYSFPVIQTEDVKVALNGVTQATTKYTVDNVSNPTKITFNNTSIDSSVQNTSGAPKSGVRVRVYRETTVGKANGDEDPKAVFAAGSSIRAIDLNANQEQALFAIHELQTRPIETEDIQDSAITVTKVGPDAVDGTKIADDSINSEHYVDLSIDTQHIANENVTTAKLAPDAVTASKLADDSVVTDNIVDLNVTRAKIANDAIDSSKIADNSINPEHYTDGSIRTEHIGNLQITTAKIADNAITDDKIAGGSLDNRYYTETELDNGQLDNRYFTETELTNGALDGRYFTETEADARYFNISTGDTIKDGDTFPDNDTTIATTAAINDRIIDLIDDVGGFVPIANETSFPSANPDVNNGSGTLVSVKAISSTRTPSSGTVTIANGAGTGNTVTITGCGSTVLTAGFGIIVETTSTLHTYAFHRLVPKATEVTTVAGISSNVTTVATNIADINTVADDLNEPTSEIDTVATNITNVNNVGNSIANVNTTAGSISNVNTVAGSISNVNSVASNISNVNAVNSNESNINSAVSNASNINSAVSNASNINTVAGSISNVNTTAGSITNVNTVATNIASVNNFANQYRIGSSNPTSSLDTGDLFFNTTSSSLKVYTGSAWVDGVTTTGDFALKTGNTFTGSNVHNDNVKSFYGTNSDLSIFHNGSDSVISQAASGTGDLKILSGGAVSIECLKAGAVNVGHNGSTKLATSSSGVSVTGNITVSGNVDGRDVAADGTNLDTIRSGQIGTTTTNGNIKLEPNGTGIAEVRGVGGYDGTLQLNCSQNSHGVKIKSPPHSAAQSYTLTLPSSITNNGVLTTDSSGNLSAGLLSTGNIAAGAVTGAKIANETIVNGDINPNAAIAGTKISPDFGSQNVTTTGTVNTGVINASSASDQILNLNSSDNGGVYLAFQRSGGRKGYFGFGGTGNTINLVNEISDGNIIISGSDGGSQINMLSFDTSENGKATFIGNVHCSELRPTSHLVMNSADNQVIYLGASNDVQLYHSGSNTFFQSSTGDLIFNSGGTGSTVFRSRFDSTVFANAANSQNQLVLDGGIAKLYASGNEKFRTSSTGGTLTGNLAVTGETSTTDIFLSDSILHNGDTDTKIRFPSADIFTVETGGSERFRVTTDKVMVSVDLKPDTDSQRDLGTSSNRFANGYFDTLYGDGSNLTGVSSAEIYGFNTDANGNLIVTTTNGGADNISGSTFDAFEDVVFAATGISFSLDTSGDLIATIS